MAVDVRASDGRMEVGLPVALFPGVIADAIHIWVSRRVSGAWGVAELVGPPISTAAHEYYPALGIDDSLYFASDREGAARLYKAQRRLEGGFDAPVTFGPSTLGLVAGDTALAPDQSYLIMSSSPQGVRGRGDLHVSFRRADGSWSDLMRLGSTINTPDHEWRAMAQLVRRLATESLALVPG